MANDLTITAATDEVVLDDRSGTASFTVANTTGDRQRVVAVVRPEQPAQAGWYHVAPPVARGLERHGAATYTVGVEVPAEAAPGTYRFRLRVHAAEGDPHEVWADGPDVAVAVPEPATGAGDGGGGLPWRVAAVGAAVVVLGVLGVLVFGDDGGEGDVEAIEEGVAALTSTGSADLDPAAPVAEATEAPNDGTADEEGIALELDEDAVDELLASPGATVTSSGDDLGFEQISIDQRLVGRNGARLALLEERSAEACLEATPGADRVDLFAAEDAPAVCVVTTEGNRSLLIEIERTSRTRDGISEPLVLVAFQTFEAR